MKVTSTILTALMLVMLITACQKSDLSTFQSTEDVNLDKRSSLNLGIAPATYSSNASGELLSSALAEINSMLAARGANFAVEKAEYVTKDPQSEEEAGQTIFANDRTLRLSSRWVAGDPRRLADGSNITYLNDASFMIANFGTSAALDAEPAIDASFDTWDQGTQCSNLPLVKRTDTGVFPSAIFAGGDPFAADIVELGFLPGFIFDLVLGAGASQNVLGVTFTFVFGSFDSEGNFTPSDINNDGNTDTALKEVWYNDDFFWSTNGSGIDIETVALHENGHALELGHFGKIAINSGGNVIIAPRAVMNAFILGLKRDLNGTDLAAHCGAFASWPN